jgi:hypothetical protein
MMIFMSKIEAMNKYVYLPVEGDLFVQDVLEFRMEYFTVCRLARFCSGYVNTGVIFCA